MTHGSLAYSGTCNAMKYRNHLERDLTLKELDVLRDVQFVLPTVALQVRVQYIVTLHQNTSHVPKNE